MIQPTIQKPQHGYRRRSPGILLAALVLAFLVCLPVAQATEEILGYHSRVTIQPDGDLMVTETIRVTAEGQEIKRGIYRDFPTKYRTARGKTMRVGFELLKVQRDGKPEAHHMETKGNGLRIYIGHKDRYLQPGAYTYQITYRTTRQLGFFEEFDELYWNVTGNDWAFPIREASCLVELPPGAPEIQVAAYTGPQGSQGQDFSINRDEYGNPYFSTTRILRPGEGLTVSVAWTKGYVAPPTKSQKWDYFLADYQSLLVGLAILVVVTCYYLLVWLLVGKDPAKGTIVPLYDPPAGISPAAARYITEMGFDKKAFAAALVSMAVKGYHRIEQNGDDTYTLVRTPGEVDPPLSPGERAVAKVLFRNGNRIPLEKQYHRKLGRAVTALTSGLKREYGQTHFMRNRGYFIPGLIISLIALATLVFTGNDKGGGFFMMIWLSGWTAGCTFLGWTVFELWKGRQWGTAMFMTFFALPFFIGELVGIWAFSSMVSPTAPLILIALVIINVAFFQWLKAPTRAGRRIMDALEGFRLYMQIAEKDRLNLLNPPERTPALFERYLPYALALDVEQDWSEQFADVLSAARHTETAGPAWYRGTTSYSNLGNSLGSAFSGAVSSASTAPGSSSGSGGGGSSGGGGGGGGGGGW